CCDGAGGLYARNAKAAVWWYPGEVPAERPSRTLRACAGAGERAEDPQQQGQCDRLLHPDPLMQLFGKHGIQEPDPAMPPIRIETPFPSPEANQMIRNTRLVPALTLAVLLSACGSQDGTSARDVENGDDANRAPAAASTPAPATFSGPVQGGSFVLPFEATQRYDRQALTEDTRRRQRQVLIEAVGVPAGDVLPAVGAQLEASGYKGGKVTEYRGGDRQYFRKKGHDQVAVLVRARGAGGPELRNPAATASIYMTETAAESEEGSVEE